MSGRLDSRRLHSCLACQDLTYKQHTEGSHANYSCIRIEGRQYAPRPLVASNHAEVTRPIHAIMARWVNLHVADSQFRVKDMKAPSGVTCNAHESQAHITKMEDMQGRTEESLPVMWRIEGVRICVRFLLLSVGLCKGCEERGKRSRCKSSKSTVEKESDCCWLPAIQTGHGFSRRGHEVILHIPAVMQITVLRLMTKQTSADHKPEPCLLQSCSNHIRLRLQLDVRVIKVIQVVVNQELKD